MDNNLLCLNITYVPHAQNTSTKRIGATENLLIENFSINLKAVHHDFKTHNTSIKKLPTKKSVKTFWKGIFQKK